MKGKLKLHIPPVETGDEPFPFPGSATSGRIVPDRPVWRLHDPGRDAEESLSRAERSIEELERIFGSWDDDDDRPRAA